MVWYEVEYSRKKNENQYQDIHYSTRAKTLDEMTLSAVQQQLTLRDFINATDQIDVDIDVDKITDKDRTLYLYYML